MPTRRTEPAVVEPVETVKQENKEPETKYRMDKLRTKCMQLFHITTSTFDGAMYGCTATETNGLERSDKAWQEVLLNYLHRK